MHDILKKLGYVFVTILFAIGYFIVINIVDNNDYHPYNPNRDFTTGWVLVNDDGSKKPIEIPHHFEDEFVIENTLPTVSNKTVLLLRVNYKKVLVYVEDELIHEGYEASYGHIKTDTSNYLVAVNLRSEYSDKTIKVVLEPRESIFNHSVSDILVTTQEDFALATVADNWAIFALAIVLIVIGSLSLGIFIVLKIKKFKVEKKLINIFALIAIVSVLLFFGTITDVHFYSVLTGKLAMSGVLHYLSFIVMPVVIFEMVKTYVNKRHIVLDIYQHLSVGIIILSFALFFTGVTGLHQLIPLTHISFILLALIIIGLLIQTFRTPRIRKLKTITVGISISLILCLIALIFYILSIPWMSIVCIAGIIVVISAAIDSIGRLYEKAKEVVREEEYFHYAYTDGLTGLLNRKSYEEKLEDLQVEHLFNDVVFIVFDINDLKLANDTLGHQAGDEIIIATAKIIKEVFGDLGICYRIGGDEYVCVIEKEVKEEKVKELLNTFEIKVAEWKGKIVPSLSVAYGYSIMNKKDANKIHNVIHLADEIMYFYKKNYHKNNEL